MNNELYRQLPSISEVLESDDARLLIDEFGAGAVKHAARLELAVARVKIAQGAEMFDATTLPLAIRMRLLQLSRAEGRRAINATGILLHTGLGRAPLSETACSSLALARGYSVLQTDRATGERSLREINLEAMLRELTGCEAATVVNNNAAATMLILNSLAANREVVISRGQLIEIGGAYRMTDVMAMSGCRLREVGCTNRTHLRDYENAINEDTGALIHVHTSNYRVRGFAGTPPIRELAALGRKRGLPVIDDLGSGALVNLSRWGLADEPLVADSLKAGADVVCFSGDKLICGPQSGIICGRKEIVEKIRKNPFARMFRVCKLTLAALETTLLHFLNGDYETEIPFYRFLSRPMEELRQAAGELITALAGHRASFSAVASSAHIGSGSIPDEEIPSCAVSIKPENLSVGELSRRLRCSFPGVFGRIQNDEVLLDLRTVFPDEIETLATCVAGALEPGP
jgi:L-seryl-tRNA(Ser) seleniumtransferase